MLYIGYLITAFRQFLWACQALAYLRVRDNIPAEKHKNSNVKKHTTSENTAYLTSLEELEKMWKWLLLLISSLSKPKLHLQASNKGKTREEGGGSKERATNYREGGGAQQENNSSSPTVRSHLSEEVRPFLMGGSVLIRVSSWPFSNFTHQREHHPAAGIPERGAAGIWRIFRDLLVEPRVIWTHRGEKK